MIMKLFSTTEMCECGVLCVCVCVYGLCGHKFV